MMTTMGETSATRVTGQNGHDQGHQNEGAGQDQGPVSDGVGPDHVNDTEGPGRHTDFIVTIMVLFCIVEIVGVPSNTGSFLGFRGHRKCSLPAVIDLSVVALYSCSGSLMLNHTTLDSHYNE